jgi:hypothetical protein
LLKVALNTIKLKHKWEFNYNTITTTTAPVSSVIIQVSIYIPILVPPSYRYCKIACHFHN